MKNMYRNAVFIVLIHILFIALPAASAQPCNMRAFKNALEHSGRVSWSPEKAGGDLVAPSPVTGISVGEGKLWVETYGGGEYSPVKAKITSKGLLLFRVRFVLIVDKDGQAERDARTRQIVATYANENVKYYLSPIGPECGIQNIMLTADNVVEDGKIETRQWHFTKSVP